MNKAVVMTQIEMPRLGKDTRVEVEPDGELVLFNGAPEAPTIFLTSSIETSRMRFLDSAIMSAPDLICMAGRG